MIKICKYIRVYKNNNCGILFIYSAFYRKLCLGFCRQIHTYICMGFLTLMKKSEINQAIQTEELYKLKYNNWKMLDSEPGAFNVGQLHF